MDHLVLTVIAPDQPGLVERIAQCIAAHGGNWLESRMSRMAGQFAGILKVAVPAEGYDELVEGLQALNSQGIRVLVAESGIEPVCTWKPIHLDLVGNDRPGIVRDITRLLEREDHRHEHLAARLATLGPAQTLARGYAIVQNLDDDGRVARARTDLPEGARVRIRVADGAVAAQVTQQEGTP